MKYDIYNTYFLIISKLPFSSIKFALTTTPSTLWKDSVHSDGHQFHQYQQKEQLPLILSELTEHKTTTTYDVENLDPRLYAIYSFCVYI
jgi:hypothetical protein